VAGRCPLDRARAAPERASAVSAVDEDGRGRVELAGTTIALEPQRVLHAGDAYGPDRIPRTLDRLVTRAIGGATSETRWLGRATDAAEPGRSGWAVYERVPLRMSGSWTFDERIRDRLYCAASLAIVRRIFEDPEGHTS